jgi:hypothetical protein
MRYGLRVAAIAACLSTPALGGDTVAYSYDALGRLVHVAHSGSVNAGQVSAYAYDPVDNRTNVAVTIPPPPSTAFFSIGAASGAPGSVLQFVIYDAGPLSAVTSVAFATVNGTGLTGAVSGTDYVAVSGTLVFQPGDTQKLVSVQTITNSAKPSSSFKLQLSGPSTGSYIIAPGSGVGTIGSGTCTPPRCITH